MSMNKRSYVMVIRGQECGRVAQIVDYLHDKSIYAIRINYNGYTRFVASENLRIATQNEKKKDKKLHNHEIQLDRHDKSVLDGFLYEIH